MEITSVPCAACQRLNLPGGVRCIYCGTPYPPKLDFDLGENNTPAAPGAVETAASHPASAASATLKQGRAAGAVSSIGLLLLKGKSLLTLLKIGKIALTLSTMLVSIAVYAQIYRWPFAAGFVICILVHELGHVFVNWRKGIPQTAPMFIPFLGAAIFVKRFPNDPTSESESGAGGPIAGALAALVCFLIGHLTGNPFWYALAGLGFIINLFNLAPVWQLDGAHIAAVFSPRLWNGVMFVMLLVALKFPLGGLWLVLAANLLARISGSGNGSRYLLASPRAALRMAAIYVLLCVGLSYGMQHTARFYGTQMNPDYAAVRSGRRVPTRDTSITPEQMSSTDDLTPSEAAVQARTTAHKPSRFMLTPEREQWVQMAAVGIVVAIVIGTGFVWFLIAYFLAAASRQLANRRLAVLPVLMFALLLLLMLIGGLMKSVPHGLLQLMGAYWAAAAAALGYAIYQYTRLRRVSNPTLHLALIAGCLGWAAGGALLVAYAFNNWLTALVVGVLLLAFYGRYPWMLAGLLARWAEEMNDYARAEVLLRRAIALRPEKPAEAGLWRRLARLMLHQDRGTQALDALNAYEAILAELHTGPQPYLASLPDLEFRASALTLLERYDEALICCEQVLQSPPADHTPALRLFVVHNRLSRIALSRGWADEAIAQADWSLKAAAKLTQAVHSRLYVVRAAAKALLNQADEARKDCDLALSGAVEPYVRAWSATIQAQTYLVSGNVAEAEKATERALRLLPGSLRARYWRGIVLNRAGRTSEGAKFCAAWPRTTAGNTGDARQPLPWHPLRRYNIEDFRNEYGLRAGMESTLSQAVRRCELRRSRYIGQAKTHLNDLMIATSLNLMWMIAWLMLVDGGAIGENTHFAISRLPPKECANKRGNLMDAPTVSIIALPPHWEAGFYRQEWTRSP